MKYLFVSLSVLLLIYLFLPGSTSINDFPALPDSVKSTLEGDVSQVPNVKAYFSFSYRDFVTKLYSQSLQKTTWFPFSPIKLNYPPEYAFIFIKDQTQSTYLEEYVYPLRESLFVNGMEPFYEKDHAARYAGATPFVQDKKNYDTKTTLRFYPSTLISRLIIWLGINLSLIGIWKVGKRIVYARA